MYGPRVEEIAIERRNLDDWHRVMPKGSENHTKH